MPHTRLRPSGRLVLSLITCGVLAAALLVSGCRRAPKTGAALVFALENSVATIDPLRTLDVFSLRVAGQVFEGLVALDANGNVVPKLAEKWETPDGGLTWVFHLRKGVRFHPDPLITDPANRVMVADDVVFSLERLLRTGSTYAFVLSEVIVGAPEFQKTGQGPLAGVRAVNEHTVEVRLQWAEPAFIRRLTSPAVSIYPREIAGLDGDRFGRERALGTGAYLLKSRDDLRISLQRFDAHWSGGGPGARDVEFRVVTNDQVRLTELRNGRIHAMDLPPALLRQVTSGDAAEPKLNATWAPEFALASFATLNAHFVGFNTERVPEDLRRAVSRAIDRGEIVRTLFAGSAVVNPDPVPSALWRRSGDAVAAPSLPEPPARSLGRPLRILVHEKKSAEQIGTLIQAQLRRAGIEAELERLTFDAAIGRVLAGDADAFCLFFEYVFSDAYPILDNFFNPAKVPIPNLWRLREDAIAQRIAGLRQLGEGDAREQALAQCLAEIRRLAPAAFLLEERSLLIHRRDVQGLALNPHGIPLLQEVRAR